MKQKKKDAKLISEILAGSVLCSFSLPFMEMVVHRDISVSDLPNIGALTNDISHGCGYNISPEKDMMIIHNHKSRGL